MAGLTRFTPETWGGARQALIIVLSLIFYAIWKIDYLWLLLGSIIFSFSFGWLIHQNKGKTQKLILSFAVAVNLGALVHRNVLSCAFISLIRASAVLNCQLTFLGYEFRSLT